MPMFEHLSKPLHLHSPLEITKENLLVSQLDKLITSEKRKWMIYDNDFFYFPCFTISNPSQELAKAKCGEL